MKLSLENMISPLVNNYVLVSLAPFCLYLYSEKQNAGNNKS